VAAEGEVGTKKDMDGAGVDMGRIIL